MTQIAKKLTFNTLSILYITILCCLNGTVLYAQQPNIPPPGIRIPSGENIPAGPPTEAEPIDTTPLTYMLSVRPETLYPGEDTLPDFHFRMYDPARAGLFDYGTLGVLGGAARPLWFETRAQRGFHTGIQPFDLYRLKPEELRFYKSRRTYTQVFFSRGIEQNDDMVRARASRTFAKGLMLALDWKSFQNVGQFRSQNGRHRALSIGIWYPINKRYDFSIIATVNADQQRENGGIVSNDTLISELVTTQGPITVPVRLRESTDQFTNVSRLTDRQLYGVQHLTFGQAPKRALQMTHILRARSEGFKFASPGPDLDRTVDAVFFREFLTDRRGLRHAMQLRSLENTVTLGTFKNKKSGGTADRLTVGLTHTLFQLRQEPRDSVINNVFALGNLAITPSAGFQLTAEGALGLLANLGEYQLDGRLVLGLGKAGTLKAALHSRRTPPSLMAHQLFVTSVPVWYNDFAKPVESSLSVTYALPLLGLEAIGQTHLLNNFIYFDQRGRAAQTTAPLQIVQLAIRFKWRFGPLHTDNAFGVQQIGRNDVLRLPPWFSKNSLYLEGLVFKKRMLANVGIDFRMNGAFKADAYQPLFWQHHLQDDFEAPAYPWADGFVSMKIKTFRFFFRYENLTRFVIKDKAFYQAALYPQPLVPAFRFGISWRFLDSNRPDPGGNNGGGPPAGSGTGPGGFRSPRF